MEVEMRYGLGQFGDERLQKGGPFCIAGLLRLASGAWRYAGSAAIGLARSG
jgi:hypothetical protein